MCDFFFYKCQQQKPPGARLHVASPQCNILWNIVLKKKLPAFLYQRNYTVFTLDDGCSFHMCGSSETVNHRRCSTRCVLLGFEPWIMIYVHRTIVTVWSSQFISFSSVIAQKSILFPHFHLKWSGMVAAMSAHFFTCQNSPNCIIKTSASQSFHVFCLQVCHGRSNSQPSTVYSTSRPATQNKH